MIDNVVIGAVVLFFVVLFVAGLRAMQRDRRAVGLVAHLQAQDESLFTHYPQGNRYQITQVNVRRERWKPYVLDVTREAITIYDIAPELNRRFVLDPVDLRWFGRPKKYTSGTNEIWLHAEIEGRWWLLRLQLSRGKMQDLVRELKRISTPELVTAYRRRRPYIHAEPVRARPATQDMLGAWTLDSPVSLYLMPLYLVVLRGATIERVIPLAEVQNVAAVKRLDRPRGDGLVRFDLGEEQIAFALPMYRTYAGLIAEAARRTLEDPVRWERKKKKSEGDWWADEDDFDEDMLDDERYDAMMPGYDGELWDGELRDPMHTETYPLHEPLPDDDEHASYRIKG